MPVQVFTTLTGAHANTPISTQRQMYTYRYICICICNRTPLTFYVLKLSWVVSRCSFRQSVAVKSTSLFIFFGAAAQLFHHHHYRHYHFLGIYTLHFPCASLLAICLLFLFALLWIASVWNCSLLIAPFRRFATSLFRTSFIVYSHILFYMFYLPYTHFWQVWQSLKLVL